MKWGEENERQKVNNVNCEEMRFVIRNLVYVEDLSPATAREIPFGCGLKLRRYFPKEEGMMWHSGDRYFPQI